MSGPQQHLYHHDMWHNHGHDLIDHLLPREVSWGKLCGLKVHPPTPSTHWRLIAPLQNNNDHKMNLGPWMVSSLIKNYMARSVDATSRRVKALVPLVFNTIPDEDKWKWVWVQLRTAITLSMKNIFTLGCARKSNLDGVHTIKIKNKKWRIHIKLWWR